MRPSTRKGLSRLMRESRIRLARRPQNKVKTYYKPRHESTRVEGGEFKCKAKPNELQAKRKKMKGRHVKQRELRAERRTRRERGKQRMEPPAQTTFSLSAR